ncbi:hypothetical protein [Mangrovicoccus sp. HB161399]|uniref:hypothetical protein n=1 Tax=Mangrovicoccus sp. HB161399 TaxID=2720392 RepID=UPI0015532309|nr:hypothetical protein [Mangrovicoccus sp. HB161399]
MHDPLIQALFMCVLVMAAVAAPSISSSLERTKQAKMRECPVETLQMAANQAIVAKEGLDPPGLLWVGRDSAGLRRPAPAEWIESAIPLNRPEGNWVAWRFRGGKASVKGTQQHSGEIDAFIRALEKPFDSLHGLMEIELQREPDGLHGGIISVGATVISGNRASHYSLGRLDSVATSWLASTYGSDLPIAAELVRLASNGRHYRIEIACLMPSRGQRAQYAL